MNYPKVEVANIRLPFSLYCVYQVDEWANEPTIDWMNKSSVDIMLCDRMQYIRTKL